MTNMFKCTKMQLGLGVVDARDLQDATTCLNWIGTTYQHNC